VCACGCCCVQRKEDDELLYYLLQLVQALRFEAQDNSRLARFLVNRATHNPAFATFLHWCAFLALRPQ
jgi:phosphatidylinositol 3-kinase